MARINPVARKEFKPQVNFSVIPHKLIAKLHHVSCIGYVSICGTAEHVKQSTGVISEQAARNITRIELLQKGRTGFTPNQSLFRVRSNEGFRLRDVAMNVQRDTHQFIVAIAPDHQPLWLGYAIITPRLTPFDESIGAQGLGFAVHTFEKDKRSLLRLVEFLRIPHHGLREVCQTVGLSSGDAGRNKCEKQNDQISDIETVALRLLILGILVGCAGIFTALIIGQRHTPWIFVGLTFIAIGLALSAQSYTIVRFLCRYVSTRFVNEYPNTFRGPILFAFAGLPEATPFRNVLFAKRIDVSNETPEPQRSFLASNLIHDRRIDEIRRPDGFEHQIPDQAQERQYLRRFYSSQMDRAGCEECHH